VETVVEVKRSRNAKALKKTRMSALLMWSRVSLLWRGLHNTVGGGLSHQPCIGVGPGIQKAPGRSTLWTGSSVKIGTEETKTMKRGRVCLGWGERYMSTRAAAIKAEEDVVGYGL